MSNKKEIQAQRRKRSKKRYSNINSAYEVHITSHGPIEQNAMYFVKNGTKPKSLWEWQVKARKKSHGNGKYGKFSKRFFAIQAPCGSGKTTLGIALGVDDIVFSGFSRKQLYIVPQRHIGDGFSYAGESSTILVKVGRKIWEWHIRDDENFCSNANIERLIKWLLEKPEELVKECHDNVISGLNAVCCYQSLVIAWSRLTKKQKKQAISNLTLRVDEAHHLKHVLDELEFESDELKEAYKEDATGIGNICTFIMNCDEITTSKIHTTSATMYRGDKKFIFSDSVRDVFEYYNYSWAEHFDTLDISEFNLCYSEYDIDPIRQIADNILAEPNESHLVIFPSKGHKWRSKDGDELERLIQYLRDGSMPEERIMDLITKEKQDKNKKKLRKEPMEYDPDNLPNFSVIIACTLGREGTNIPYCSRLHNSATENSITQAMQTLGRLLRRWKGKIKIESIMYINEFVSPEHTTKKDLLQDRQSAMLLCMVLKNEFMPILFPVIPPDENGDSDPKTNNKPKQTNLQEYLGENFQNIMLELSRRHDALSDKREVFVDEMIHELLEDYGIAENIDVLTKAMKVNILRQTLRENRNVLPGFDGLVDLSVLRDFGYDTIRKVCHPTLHFMSSLGNGKKDFAILKKIGEVLFTIKKIKGIGYEATLEEIKEYIRDRDLSKKETLELISKGIRVTADKWEFKNG